MSLEKALARPGFELVLPIPFHTTIIVTVSAPLEHLLSSITSTKKYRMKMELYNNNNNNKRMQQISTEGV